MIHHNSIGDLTVIRVSIHTNCNHSIISSSFPQCTGITTLEAVRKYVENHSPITHGVEFRIKVLTEADVQEAPPRPSSGVSVELRKWIILVVFVLLQALL